MPRPYPKDEEARRAKISGYLGDALACGKAAYYHDLLAWFKNGDFRVTRAS